MSPERSEKVMMLSSLKAVIGLMDRALDLKPEVTQGCGFESRLRQEVHDCSPSAAQSAAHCSKCVLCIIVYVTNKARPSLICIKGLGDVIWGTLAELSGRLGDHIFFGNVMFPGRLEDHIVFPSNLLNIFRTFSNITGNFRGSNYNVTATHTGSWSAKPNRA